MEDPLNVSLFLLIKCPKTGFKGRGGNEVVRNNPKYEYERVVNPRFGSRCEHSAVGQTGPREFLDENRSIGVFLPVIVKSMIHRLETPNRSIGCLPPTYGT